MRFLLRNIFDAIFLTRPVIWIPVWGFSFLGYIAARHFVQGHYSLYLDAQTLHALVPLLFFSCSVGAVYVLNQIEDRDVDASNEGFPLLPNIGLPLRTVWGIVILLSSISLVGCSVSSITLMLLAAGSLVIGFLYSVKPFYFTGKPILDFVSNAVGYGAVAFAAGWIMVPDAPGLSICLGMSIPYILLMAAGSISSTLPDIPGDAAQGKRTTAVVFGKIPAHVIATLCIAGALGMSIVNNDMLSLLAASVSLPLYIVYFFRQSTRFMEATYKVGGAITMLLPAVLVPYFGIAALITGVSTILYFRLRHGVKYPSLTPAHEISGVK